MLFTRSSGEAKLNIKDLRLSSRWANSANYDAKRCWDGSTTGTMCHTQWQTNPWLRVDLGISAEVRTVRIYNRDDCCWDRLGNHKIFVGDTGNSNTDKLCFSGYSQKPGPVNEACSGVGRYVSIVLPGNGRLINLHEVEVWGFGELSPPPHTHTRPHPPTHTPHTTNTPSHLSLSWPWISSIR